MDLFDMETITYILRLIKQLFDTNQKWFQCHQFSTGWRHEQQLEVENFRASFWQGWNPNKHISHSTVVQLLSPTLPPHGLQHARLPCPSPSPGVYSNSCPLSWWCHPTISSSVVPFSSCPHSFPASGSFLMNWLFASGGHSIGISASVSVIIF